jgi:hypothetical protein
VACTLKGRELNKLNWSTLRMSGIFDLRGYIGNVRLANMGGSDKVIE